MKVTLQNPVRRFEVGCFEKKTIMSDCGTIALSSDELVTFVTDTGAEYDVSRKPWGYFATPSLGNRLCDFRLRAVMTVNHLGKYSILLVEEGYEEQFYSYLHEEQMNVVAWLDNNSKLNKVRDLISSELPELIED